MVDALAHTDEMQLPLCVDLDGTLIRTDLLWELLVALIRNRPWLLLLLPFWLLNGKAGFKQRLAERVTIDVSLLPYRQAVIDYIHQESAKGREIVLVTATYRRYARLVADQVGLFGRVLATDTMNLSGDQKASALIELYGEGGFEYVGNAAADLKVWRHAGRASVVSSSAAFLRRVQEIATVRETFAEEKGVMLPMLREIRPYQWVKNVLVFVPLIAAHALDDPRVVAQAAMALVAFSLCASGVYIFNDLVDLEADRAHATKRHRSLASGALSIPAGIVSGMLLLLASAVVAVMLSVPFRYALLVYFVLTVLYSLTLKSRLLVDVFCLAMLYTLRLIAGGAAEDITLSHWLLAFSIFLFLSLALVKRYAELMEIQAQGKSTATGRDYMPSDMPFLAVQGVASGFLACLILALYVSSPEVQGLYSHSSLLWAWPPLILYWVGRLWMITQRGGMRVDPVAFALRDKVSYIVVLLVGVVMWLAV